MEGGGPRNLHLPYTGTGQLAAQDEIDQIDGGGSDRTRALE
jgi:hypothetical protein